MSRKLSLKSVTMIIGALVLSSGTLAQTSDVNQQTSYASQGHETLHSRALQLPSNDSAFKELFGVPSTGGKTKSAPGELSRFWFGQEFSQGEDNYYVTFFASQEILSEDYGEIEILICRDCTADVGAVTYKKVSGQWVLISKQKKFAVAGGYGDVSEATPELLALSPTATAVMIDFIEGGQGIVESGKNMFIFSEEAWIRGGHIFTSSSRDGVEAECGYPPVIEEANEFGFGWCYKNTGVISLLDATKNGFPYLMVARTGTEEDGNGSVVPAKNLIYTFKDGRYQ